MVKVGRLFGLFSLVLAVVIAPLLGNLDQAFQFIQEFTGFVSPGALCIFLMGFFWKKANANGALAAAIGTFVFSFLMRCFLPEVSFLDRMGYVFLLCVLTMLLFGWFSDSKEEKTMLSTDRKMFQTTVLFKILSGIICLVLGCIYYLFW